MSEQEIPVVSSPVNSAGSSPVTGQKPSFSLDISDILPPAHSFF
ncbi:hypothetical protein [Oxalobacter formigenes]